MSEIMDEEEFNRIINEYYNFRSNFSDNINNSSINLSNEVCYLIEENWIDNLKKGYNEYKNLKKKNELNEEFDYSDLLPEEEPNFINIIVFYFSLIFILLIYNILMIFLQY